MEKISVILNGMKACQPLPDVEIRKLCRRAQQGDKSARQQVLRANLGLIAHVAQKFHQAGGFLDISDLIQQGALGLLHAMEKFNPRKRSRGKPVRFATYAYYWISHFIRRELENKQREIAIPTHVQHRQNADPPFQKMISLETVTTAEHPQQVGDMIKGEENCERSSQDQDLSGRVQELVQDLPVRERRIVIAHFGLRTHGAGKTLTQIAGELKVSRERVRQIQQRAIKLLRRRALPLSQALWPTPPVVEIACNEERPVYSTAPHFYFL